MTARDAASHKPAHDLRAALVMNERFQPGHTARYRGGADADIFKQPTTDVITVIIPHVSHEATLEAVLRGFALQTDKGFEIAVVENEARQTTAALIERCKSLFQHPIRHIAGGSNGRLAEARNRVIAATDCELCILMGSGCIPRPHFVAAHRRMAQPGWFVSGGTVRLRRALSEDVLARGINVASWPSARWIVAKLRGQIDRLFALAPIPLGPVRKLDNFGWGTVQHGSISIRRDDLLRIDGFEQGGVSIVSEEWDLVVRLLRGGASHKNGTAATTTLELWDERANQASMPHAQHMATQTSGERFRALAGLSTLDQGGTANVNAAVRELVGAGEDKNFPGNARRPRIAVTIVSLFRSGGLQRDCLAIAEALHDLGYAVTIFTSRIRGHLISKVPIVVLPAKHRTNHGRNAEFAATLQERTAGNFDLVVGFDKIPGLDLLYCADPPVKDSIQRLTAFRPRYRTYNRLESACFRKGSNTRLILLNPDQAESYRRKWGTEIERIRVIDPLVDRSRCRPELRNSSTRAGIRNALGIKGDELVLLSIGEQPHTKGLDRVIRALSHSTAARLLIVGPAANSSQGRHLLKLAQKLGVESRVVILGYHEDIPRIMAASDLLIHLARRETTGTVILEAVVNGLPVIVTGVSGFAIHVYSSGAGIVLREPYQESDFFSALDQAADLALRSKWSSRGVQYGTRADLYNGVQQSLFVIQHTLESTTGALKRTA
jgi:UDP-glucose:(heptosyl)LPS alpha-1,3-glucosyltransferase